MSSFGHGRCARTRLWLEMEQISFVSNRWGTSDLFGDRLGRDAFLALVHVPHFCQGWNPVFSQAWARLACVPCVRTWWVIEVTNVRRSRKTVFKISESASQVKILEQNDQLCLSATLAIVVMLPLSLVSASGSKLPFGEAVNPLWGQRSISIDSDLGALQP